MSCIACGVLPLMVNRDFVRVALDLLKDLGLGKLVFSLSCSIFIEVSILKSTQLYLSNTIHAFDNKDVLPIE